MHVFRANFRLQSLAQIERIIDDRKSGSGSYRGPIIRFMSEANMETTIRLFAVFGLPTKDRSAEATELLLHSQHTVSKALHDHQYLVILSFSLLFHQLMIESKSCSPIYCSSACCVLNIITSHYGFGA